MIHVANKKRHKGPGEYIGRPGPLGNPYSHEQGTLAQYRCTTRAEAVANYRAWIIDQISRPGPVTEAFTKLLNIYRATGTLTVICWCAPEACHGDVIKELVLYYATNPGTT